VLYPTQTDQAAGCTDPGMLQPTSDVLSWFDKQYAPEKPPVICVYDQLVAGTDFVGGTCKDTPSAGWCYVEGAANTGGCAQSIEFGAAGPPPGTDVEIACSQ